ncbi:MAG: cupin domain-containing protein [Sphingobacteriia bacterium]|nr:cupin domain-containing protein [Sphingobacteriia bacterium]
MIIRQLNKLQKIDTPHQVDVRKLYDYDNAQVMHITLQPGESLKPHITPVDVFFFILEGTTDVRVGDETISVERDCLVESPRNIVHCLSNTSRSVTRILVVKAPKPLTQTRLL